MIVKYKKIKSSASPDNNRPWYDISVSNGTLTVDVDGDKGSALDLTEKSVDIDTSGNSVVAVKQDGGLITYLEEDRYVPPLRAHLAWYSAEDDTVTVLEFVES